MSLGPACADDADLLDDDPIAGRQDPAYANSDKIWPYATIEVCWENPASSNATERQWVKDSVERTWEAVSAVDFVGWGTCTLVSKGVRIKINDERPHVGALGKQLDGKAGGMVLNFTFNFDKKWQACQSKLEACIRGDAVHEFGHALGFSHEQNRPDSPCTDSPDSDGDLALGVYDADSMMNYCNARYMTRASWSLSDLDTLAVQQLYGGNRLSLVDGLGGNCLDVENGAAGNGVRVQLWDCLGNTHQQWGSALFGRNETGAIVGNGDRCLDVREWGTWNGTPLQMWQCLQNDGQRFHLDDTEIVGFLGRCLDVKWGSSQVNTPVWLWECHEDPAQKWVFADGSIIRQSDGMCLGVDGTGNGATIRMEYCRNDDRQRWNVEVGGAIRNAAANRCIDVAGFGNKNGAAVTLYDCNGKTNQRWAFRGALRGIGDNCLDVKDWQTTNGTSVQMWDCNRDSPAQTFTYYP